MLYVCKPEDISFSILSSTSEFCNPFEAISSDFSVQTAVDRRNLFLLCFKQLKISNSETLILVLCEPMEKLTRFANFAY